MTLSNEEKCKKQVHFYQSRFRSVPTMSSTELRQRQTQDKDTPLILVDVRTQPERQTSMISGAIPLAELPTDLPANATVVTYCTIGYRSGLEAQHLLDSHPDWEGRVYSLDGILAYSYTDDPLVVPTTGETTQQVHAFGPMWKGCANETLDAKVYGVPSLLWRFLQVGGLVVVRGTQHMGAILTRCVQPKQHTVPTTGSPEGPVNQKPRG